MKLIEKLNYHHDHILVGNRMTWSSFSEKEEKEVFKLFNITKCPYCGTAMKKSSPMVDDWNEVTIFKDECPSCTWWRKNEVPQHFFTGEKKFGVLHKISNIDDNLKAGIDEIIRNNDKIYHMNPGYFEKFVGGVLKEFYDRDVVHVGKSHDGGIDLVLLESTNGKIPIQVKRREQKGRVESVSIIREFRGALLIAGYNKGIIVTTAHHFSNEAQKISEPQQGHLIAQYIDLIDCRRLLDIMCLLQGQMK